jgi:hypothetical protein
MQNPSLAAHRGVQDPARNDAMGVALPIDEKFCATLAMTAGDRADGSVEQEPQEPLPVSSLASNTHESTSQ